MIDPRARSLQLEALESNVVFFLVSCFFGREISMVLSMNFRRIFDLEPVQEGFRFSRRRSVVRVPVARRVRSLNVALTMNLFSNLFFSRPRW